MNILVINPGSSSIKFSMYGDGLRRLYEGELSGIGEVTAALEFRDAAGADLSGAAGAVKGESMEAAIGTVEREVELKDLPVPQAVGYRVVHPGPRLRGHQRLTAEVLKELHGVTAYAPLHNPEALEVIDELMRRFRAIPHVACFDTVFHETMPEEATVYPLPEEVRAQGVRRYGFHGLSCESVVEQMRAAGVLPRRMLIAHLGSGCSVTACVEGKSVDTSMGLTPMGGVVMGTRPGDIDPGLVFYLLRREGATVDSVEEMLNRHSGMKVLGGVNDMRELRRRSAAGDANAELAIRIFVNSVARAMAGMAALHGAEAVVFTGGIGEHDAATRTEITGKLQGMGMELDAGANGAGAKGVRRVSTEGARMAAWVAPADEDCMIAQHVAQMLA
ncbi:MAG TPA: acetate/propionate family kinase [Acidobacteriaceae bacterium]|nr:acetate/propionate family kinase [Acidobacteriaceae bacterium]